MVNLILSDDSISSFYSDLESYVSIKQAVKTSVDIINGEKRKMSGQQDLQNKSDAERMPRRNWKALKMPLQVRADKSIIAISKQKEMFIRRSLPKKMQQINFAPPYFLWPVFYKN